MCSNNDWQKNCSSLIIEIMVPMFLGMSNDPGMDSFVSCVQTSYLKSIPKK